jgi:RHS repeat-associated protein
MPERNSNPGNYRYGFNAQEHDDEIAGNGNIYTAEHWEYDSRIGRRWNIDPVTYSDQSSYACFNDNPIIYADPTGMEGEDVIDKKWNSITKKYEETNRQKVDNGEDTYHFTGGALDGQTQVFNKSAKSSTWSKTPDYWRNPDRYNGIEGYRKWLHNQGYNNDESWLDRFARNVDATHKDIMLDEGSGGGMMFGGFANAEGALVEEAVNLEQRAAEIHGVLKPYTQSKTTTAVGEVVSSEGKAEIWVASSEPRLRPVQRAALKAGEVEIKGQGHAEATIMNHAAKTGGTVLRVAASRPICPSCAASISTGGAVPASALKTVTTYLGGK